MLRPLCFVLMPFGKKPAIGGMVVDFDAVYRELIAPAIRDAELEPIRADEEQAGGIIHKPMFERLILCEYAVADLTCANANVFYELGLRHAVRPASTVLLFAENSGQLPFDVAGLRALPYQLGPSGEPADVAGGLAALKQRLHEAREQPTDSPIFQLVEGFPDVQRLKTDVFRDRVRYSEQRKAELMSARKRGVEAVEAVEASLGSIANADSGVVIDLFLSYRAVKAFVRMIELVPKMSAPLAESVLVREQLALAMNRVGRDDEAERELLELLRRRGPSSETYGLLGRVYKDRWDAAVKAGDRLAAAGHLKQAIRAYLNGFEADWRDAYPGVNAVTLMELEDPPDPRQAELLPVVSYAVERRIAHGQPDYWDHATLVELAVLGRDRERAVAAAANAVAAIREPWEPETTARNLGLIRRAREARGEQAPWVEGLERELTKRAAPRS